MRCLETLLCTPETCHIPISCRPSSAAAQDCIMLMLHATLKPDDAAHHALPCCREGCTPAEFEALVQRNVAANAGLGFAGLADLVTTIAQRELQRLAALGQGPSAGDAALSQRDSPAAAGCQHCAVADAAATAAEDLAAGCGTAESEADADVSGCRLQQLHCVFNLRRGLFVLEAIEAHACSVLGSAHAAQASRFASDLRQIRLVLDRFDQATVGA
jgi:hypothetical protein